MNNSYVVLDSGIFLATVTTEQFTKQSEALIKDCIQNHVKFVAPVLLRYEIIAVTRKWIYRNLISHSSALMARYKLEAYPIDFVLDKALLDRAFDLANQYNRPTAYDSQYLAVAERYNCEFWTADEKLYNAIHQQNAHIRWIANYGKV